MRSEKLYCEGEFVNKCILKAAEIVCPFANISLTRNAVANRISDLSADLNRQQKHKVKSFIAFSVAIDESTNITDVAQLAIFLRSVGETLTVTEEFLELVPMMDTTTANDIFISLVGALDRVGVDWARAVSVATDGAPSMGEKQALCWKSVKMDYVMEVVDRTVNFIRTRGLNHHQFDNLLSDIGVTYCLPYHTEVRWLSRGVVLKRFFNLHEEIEQFMEEKGKRVQDLAFSVDITEHLNNLNKMLQGRKKVVTQYFESIRTFKWKLTLWRHNCQCDSDLKNKFTSVDLDTFYQYLLPKHPKLTALAAKVLYMFGNLPL
uniref:DUF4371 domain-containing protein n=1 Tax=Octopus bimaculoides TaxID=37653 RepID=A0A0L8GXP5_OCTBM